MKMLIHAVQYAADHSNCAVLICAGEEHHARSMLMAGRKLAEAMGFEIEEAAAWSFRIGDSMLHFRPTARSKQHAEKLCSTDMSFKAFHDHRSSGELES